MIDVMTPAVGERHGLLDPAAIGVLALDSADTVRHSNPAGAHLLGRHPDELLGMPLHHLVRSLDAELTSVAALTQHVRQRTSWSGVLEAALPHGAVRLDAMLSILSGAARPAAIAMVLVGADASPFGQLGWFALHDPLTGLANRALLADRLGLAIAQAERRGGLVATMFIDVDGFKAVNDTLGHLEGDRVLREMAERLRHLLRPTDTLARYGGDEFVAVCEAPDLSDLHEIIDRLAERAVVEVAPGWTLGTSIGIAVSTGVGIQPPDLLHQADRAMYRAKRSHRPELDVSLG